jgi:protein-tyrosine-phosphatase
MSDMKNVLFVCTGNTCRSPLAEALFLHATRDRDDFEVGSAGLAASGGSARNPETAALLKKRGIATRAFGSRQVCEAILDRATHVFAMTRGHLDLLESRFPKHAEKFYLMCEFVEIPRLGIGADVVDPIGMGPKAYEETAAMLDVAIPSVIAYIDGTSKGGRTR